MAVLPIYPSTLSDEDYAFEGDATPTVPVGPEPFASIDQANVAGPALETPSDIRRLVAPVPIKPDLFAPLIPLSKMFGVTPQTVMDALDVLTARVPVPGQEDAERSLYAPQQPPSTLAKAIAGAQGSILRGAESMTSVPMLATLGLAAAPAAVGKIASGAIAAQMASQAPEAIAQLSDAIDAKDPEKIASAVTDLAQLATFTAAAAAHVAGRSPLEKALPKSVEALKETGPAAVQPEAPPEVAPAPEPAKATEVPLDRNLAAQIGYDLVNRGEPDYPLSSLRVGGERIARQYNVPLRVVDDVRNLITRRLQEVDPEGRNVNDKQAHLEAVKDIQDGFQDAALQKIGVPQPTSKTAQESPPEPASTVKVAEPAPTAPAKEPPPSEPRAAKTLAELSESGAGEALVAEGARMKRRGDLQAERDQLKQLIRGLRFQGDERGVAEAEARLKEVESELAGESKGIAASVRGPGALAGGEAGAVSLQPIRDLIDKAAPAVKNAYEAIKNFASEAKETGKEAIATPKMTDYRRSVLNWSAKLQRSFGEAAGVQKNIQRAVPDPFRRDGITNWIQAGGDEKVLADRAAATTDRLLKRGYEAALKLTPEELDVATNAKRLLDDLAKRGQENDVLNSFKENYVTQIWDLGLGKTKSTGGSSSRILKEKFKYSKASTFPTFFHGEQAGYKPKTKDISKLLPIYMHEMNSVIAARELVKEMSKGVASDGRPLVAPRGVGTPVAGAGGEATLIMPKAVKGEETLDYKVLPNQPALQNWRWAAKDTAGAPIFLKSDLALHPEAYNRIKSVLGRSAIREWYSTPTTRLAAVPKLLVKGLDSWNSVTKRTMLGLIAPFHQTQTGTHGVGHRVNPFGAIPPIDLANDPLQMDAARHGLMLQPDRASENQFMEGLRPSGLISRIPLIGKVSDMYTDYLFKQYIPGLKFKTYEAILDRNRQVYARDLAAGTVKTEDVKLLSAQQANAAYGHLNYADLGRNPTIQHLMQFFLLAPDFLEARGRFAGQAIKGLTGAKAGREQILALATLAIAQAAGAYITAQLSGGEWDPKHPFEFSNGARKYTLRSVPEDMSRLLSDTRAFIHARLSPILGKGAIQLATGKDYAGRNVTVGETAKELITQPLPLTLRALPGVREISGAERPGAIKWWEQLAGSVGLKISRFSPNKALTDIHTEWLKNNPDPIIKQDYERNQAATYPLSKYRSLDAALDDHDPQSIAKAIEELRPLVRKDSDILKRMRPYIGKDLNINRKPLFQESAKLERKFVQSLEPEQRLLYERAMKERHAQWLMFLDVWRQRGPRSKLQTTNTNTP